MIKISIKVKSRDAHLSEMKISKIFNILVFSGSELNNISMQSSHHQFNQVCNNNCFPKSKAEVPKNAKKSFN